MLVVPQLHRRRARARALQRDRGAARRATTCCSATAWPCSELRARDASLDLGITLNLTVADPVDPTDPADVDAARRIDGQFNRCFLDPIFRGEYPADVVEDSGVDAAATAFEAAIQPGDLEIDLDARSTPWA